MKTEKIQYSMEKKTKKEKNRYSINFNTINKKELDMQLGAGVYSVLINDIIKENQFLKKSNEIYKIQIELLKRKN